MAAEEAARTNATTDKPSGGSDERCHFTQAHAWGLIAVASVLWAVVIPGYYGRAISKSEDVCRAINRRPPTWASGIRAAPHIEKAKEACQVYFKALEGCRAQESNIQKHIADLLHEEESGGVDGVEFDESLTGLKEEGKRLGIVRTACSDLQKVGPPFDLVGLGRSTSLPLYLLFYVFVCVLMEKKSRLSKKFPHPASLLLPVIAILCFCVALPRLGIELTYLVVFGLGGVWLWGCSLPSKCVWMREGLSTLFVGAAYGLLVDAPVAWFDREVINQAKSQWAYFAFKSASVDPLSWVLEHGRSLTMAMLIALLWNSLLGINQAKEEQLKLDGDGSSRASLGAMEDAAREFEQWQLESVMLAAAFLPWSYYDWQMLSESTSRAVDFSALDLYQALIDHLTWIGTWALLSVPVIRAFQNWRESKRKFIQQLPKHSSSSDVTKFVLEARPVSNLQLLLVSVAGTIALLLPILRIK